MRLIDADELITKVANVVKEMARSDAQKAIMGRVIYIIKQMPMIDAVPMKHAHWIALYEISGLYETEIEEACSNCGRHVTRYDTQPQDNYCPLCGAIMDEVDLG